MKCLFIFELLNDKAYFDEFFSRIEREKEALTFEQYLSLLAALVLLIPEYRKQIEEKKRLFEVGKIMLSDGFDYKFSVLPGVNNVMYTSLYLKILFPDEFDAYFKINKEANLDYISEIISQRTESLFIENWDVARSINFLMRSDEKYLSNKNSWLEKTIEIDDQIKEREKKGWDLHGLAEALSLINYSHKKIKVNPKWFAQVMDHDLILLKNKPISKYTFQEMREVLWLFVEVRDVLLFLPRLNFSE